MEYHNQSRSVRVIKKCGKNWDPKIRTLLTAAKALAMTNLVHFLAQSRGSSTVESGQFSITCLSSVEQHSSKLHSPRQCRCSRFSHFSRTISRFDENFLRIAQRRAQRSRKKLLRFFFKCIGNINQGNVTNVVQPVRLMQARRRPMVGLIVEPVIDHNHACKEDVRV